MANSSDKSETNNSSDKNNKKRSSYNKVIK